MRRLLALLALAALAAPAPPATAAGPAIDTVAGGRITGAPAPAVMLTPAGVAALGDVLFVADPVTDAVWRVDSGKASLLAGDPRACGGHTPSSAGAGTRRPCHPDTFQFSALGPLAAGGGTLYAADLGTNRVYRVDTASGEVTHLAGRGGTTYGPNEEGADALLANLNQPSALAVGPDGLLYIADTGNARIRRVAADGTIWTVAGCSECRFSLRHRAPLASTYLAGLKSVAVAPDGALFVATATGVYQADTALGQWLEVAGSDHQSASSIGLMGDGGPAEDALFGEIVALAFAPDGALVVVDRQLDVVRRIDAPAAGSSTIRRVAGGGITTDDGAPGEATRLELSGDGVPGTVVLADGDVVVSDVGAHRLRRVDAATSTVSRVAGNGVGGPATRLPLDFDFQPRDVLGGFSGDGGPARHAQLFGPTDVAADADGNVYVVDRYAHRVRRIASDGTITTVAGSGCAGRGCTAPSNVGDGAPADKARLFGATAISLSGDQLLIVDRGNRRIRQVNLGDEPVTVYPEAAAPVTIAPGRIATVAGNGQRCSNVQVACGEGLYALDAPFGEPGGAVYDAQGNLWVSDSYQHTIRRFDAATGTKTPAVGVPFHSNCEAAATQDGVPGAATLLCGPSNLAIAPDGTLYVSETGGYGFGSGYVSHLSVSRIRRVDIGASALTSRVVAGNGTAGASGDGGDATQAQLAFPRGLAFGPDGALYVADTGNSRIRRIADGRISTVAGTGAYDGRSSGGCSARGDGGAPADAGLCAPAGVAVAADGTIYVADTINNRVRRVTGVAVPAAVLTIQGFTYSALTVAPGQSVRVDNRDTAPHTVTADDGSFDVEVAGGSEATFTAPSETGSYPYSCTVHPSMRGTLQVAESP